MDADRFDTLARTLQVDRRRLDALARAIGRPHSRRATLAALLGLVAAAPNRAAAEQDGCNAQRRPGEACTDNCQCQATDNRCGDPRPGATERNVGSTRRRVRSVAWDRATPAAITILRVLRGRRRAKTGAAVAVLVRLAAVLLRLAARRRLIRAWWPYARMAPVVRFARRMGPSAGPPPTAAARGAVAMAPAPIRIASPVGCP